jgi:hypothetical protein
MAQVNRPGALYYFVRRTDFQLCGNPRQAYRPTPPFTASSPFQNNLQKPVQPSPPDAVMPPGGVEQLTGPHARAPSCLATGATTTAAKTAGSLSSTRGTWGLIDCQGVGGRGQPSGYPGWLSH